jgi:hypothetical protein
MVFGIEARLRGFSPFGFSHVCRRRVLKRNSEKPRDDL